MAMLVISIIFIAVCFITIKFRDYFSKVNTLPSWPVVVKSALFWGGVLLIICLGCALWATLYSIKGFEYFMLVPIAAFIGGVYGFVFDWKMRKKNLSTSLTNRALVGLAVGVVLGILFSVLCAINLDLSYNPSPGYGAIIELGLLYFFPTCIIVSSLLLGLLPHEMYY
jgi:hypothetical protein